MLRLQKDSFPVYPTQDEFQGCLSHNEEKELPLFRYHNAVSGNFPYWLWRNNVEPSKVYFNVLVNIYPFGEFVASCRSFLLLTGHRFF